MKRLFLSFLLVCMCHTVLAGSNDYDVYLLIGQSNMAGRGTMIDDDSLSTIHGVYLLNNEGKIEEAKSPLNRYSNIRKELSMQQVGPGAGFGERMHKLTGRKILLVVNAKGGSSIKEWEPGIEGSLTDATLDRAVQCLKYGRFKGILWHQGETDADMDSEEYAQRFDKVITEIRSRLNAADVPVAIGELGQWNWRPSVQVNGFNEKTIDAVLRRTKNAYKVHSDGLKRLIPTDESDPHFGRSAQIELGKRYAEVLLPHISDVYITAFKDDRRAGISFTYDDGMLCHYTDVAPQLEKRGFRGTFWIIGANMGKDEPDYPWMNWDQVADLAKRGHEMSNHSWNHPNLPSLDKETLMQEIFMCDSALEKATGKRPVTFCYPYNAMNGIVVNAASANRVGTRTFQDAQGQNVSKCTAESLSAWLKKTIDCGDWSVTMTHGTTYGYDMWNEPELLWNLYDEVKAEEDKVWVGTFAEISAYREERLNTSLKIRKTGNTWSIKPVMSLDERLFNESLTLRINGDFSNKKIVATQGKNAVEVTNRKDHILINFNPVGGKIMIEAK